MIIREATVNDAGEILEIYAPYVENTAISFEYDVPSLEEFTERIRNISAKYPYIVALEDGKILGYAYAGVFKGRTAYDRSVETTIYVREDCHGRRIGSALYKELERILTKMGILNMNACIAMPRGNDAHLTDGSIKFHSKLGFSEVGVFHECGYKFDTWYDMIWMEKMLGEHKVPAVPVVFGEWKKYL